MFFKNIKYFIYIFYHDLPYSKRFVCCALLLYNLQNLFHAAGVVQFNLQLSTIGKFYLNSSRGLRVVAGDERVSWNVFQGEYTRGSCFFLPKRVSLRSTIPSGGTYKDTYKNKALGKYKSHLIAH